MLKRNVLLTTVAALSLMPSLAIADPLRADGSSLNFPALTESPLLAQNNREDALLGKLNLSDSQKEQIQTIRGNYRSQIETKSNAIRQANDTMKTLMANGNTSRSQLETQHRTLAGLRQDLANLHFQQMMDIRDVLTPSQRESFATQMQQRNQNNGDRRSRGLSR